MKKKNRNILGILLFSWSISQISGQEIKTISLAEAIDLGINNSKNLKIDEAKIEENTAQLIEAKNRQLPDFKLDINDRLAFSKMLFDNSQSELNEVVKKLNSFKTLDEAKAYLSDVYYEKNWEKVDEYAQRLWSLVENKFH